MMARRRPDVSKAELEVARIVWQLDGATVRQVLERLPTDRNIEYRTVQTYLRRLVTKGYLRGKRQGRSTFYTVHVRPHRVIRETVTDFVSRLFDGDALPLFEHLISEQGLTGDEIRRLRAMLDQKEAEQDEPHAE